MSPLLGSGDLRQGGDFRADAVDRAVDFAKPSDKALQLAVLGSSVSDAIDLAYFRAD